jgi:hypothetical protein
MVTGTGDNSSEIGGLIGRNTYGRSIQCFATGAVSGENKVGGLFGYCEGGEILDNFATGKANGKESNIGGLIGSGWDVLISSSYATGSASGTNSVGGFLGFLGGNFITSTVSDCYAMGSVAGGRGVGGLVGGTDGGHTAVENSYAVGMVTGDEMVGGLVGDDFAITVEHSYWDIENAGQSFSAGGTGKTTAEMYHQGTFEGWNFDTVWWIDEGNNYPRFYWEPGAPLMPAPLFLNAGSDINLDNKVDAEDLLILLEDWGKVSTP